MKPATLLATLTLGGLFLMTTSTTHADSGTSASAQNVPERPSQTAARTHGGWTTFRVGGDMQATAVWNERRQQWEADTSAIDTPLPVGYPAPTPPGAIELKRYPEVRRAEVAGAARSANTGFWPLFRHIERNNIAMTSPVEMDYKPGERHRLDRTNWRMAFLYRTPELHPTGVDTADQRVEIRDAPALTVLSLGGRGSYDVTRVEEDLAVLEAWLMDNPEWDAAGAPRALFYNGPSWMPWRKWLEVQIPVTRTAVGEALAVASPAE